VIHKDGTAIKVALRVNQIAVDGQYYFVGLLFVRVKAYEEVYETIEDDEDDRKISYIKVWNVGQKMEVSCRARIGGGGGGGGGG
jgi:hypothetical protein